ncbi:MAG TPA: YihY/virulence factor BrkB family protein [Syntrophales bacterium]|nr:YihY/virulence factor BrkB family protein [Syntrophales bacterium]HPI57521.1 YihY/virulence factor BrkB family protein [Syntrophales bacterium]HPN24678.1 YihY/virulence factor BrkB family protein [Syntrophales bacterium]HQM29809.1 YihY/virulence factor BrkB family protein [Syntrophales bacterium]
MKPKDIYLLLKNTYEEWSRDRASLMAAALAYYTIFSLAPLAIIMIAIAGIFFGEKAAQGELVAAIQGMVGEHGTHVIQGLIMSSASKKAGIIAAAIGFATMMFGASKLFGALQDALNSVWEIEPVKGGFKGVIRKRLISMGVVLMSGLLLLASLFAGTALAAVRTVIGDSIPGIGYLFVLINFLLPFLLTTTLFAVIFKVLPDAKVAWRDVWIGAAATSFFFAIGQMLSSFYLGSKNMASTYGAAGSLVVLIFWINLAAQIFLYGAEFTQVYACRYGSCIVAAGGSRPDSAMREGRTE